MMNEVKLNTTIPQIIFQIFLFGSVWLFIPFIYSDLDLNSYDFKRGFQNLIGVALIVVLNIKWFLPSYYFKGQKPIYVGLAITSVVLIYYGVDYVVDNWLFVDSSNPHPKRKSSNSFHLVKQINKMLPYALALVGSALFEISRFANQQLKQAAQLKSEKLDAEMKLLKSQINPHFLFNALNNVYSLSYLKPEKTPQNLLKLSNMLRYMLYECNVERVTLAKEITYLEDFINLKLLKDSRGMNVKTDFEVAHPNILIAPMLLIPFVENAFKHSGIENLEKGWIEMKLKTTETSIHFKIANSIQNKQQPKDTVGGIGLPTAERLLALNYPNKHRLEIKQSEKQFLVNLEITIV